MWGCGGGRRGLLGAGGVVGGVGLVSALWTGHVGKCVGVCGRGKKGRQLVLAERCEGDVREQSKVTDFSSDSLERGRGLCVVPDFSPAAIKVVAGDEEWRFTSGHDGHKVGSR